jgi:hypothetical protein
MLYAFPPPPVVSCTVTVQLAALAVTLDTTILVTRLTDPEAGVKPVKEVEPDVAGGTPAYVHATKLAVVAVGNWYAVLP